MNSTKEIINPNKLDEKVHALIALDKQIALLKEQQDIIKDELKDIMDKYGVDMLQGINEKVRWQEQVKFLFNEQEFIKKYGQETYNYYKSKKSTSRPFYYK